MKIPLFKLLRSDKGVSFTEILVTLILISLVMALLLSLWSDLLPGLFSDRQKTLSHNREILLRQALDSSFQKISPPWWNSDYLPEKEGDTWIFPWYKGKEESQLVISFKNNSLIIKGLIQEEQSDLDNEPSESISFHRLPLEVNSIDFLMIQGNSEALPIIELTLHSDVEKQKMLFLLAAATIPGKDYEE